MTKKRSTKKTTYSNDEIAFIVAYVDYCLQSSVDYKDTVASELGKIFNHSREWDSLRRKIKSIVKQHGRTTTLIPADFIEQGTACLNMDGLEDGIATAIESYHSRWGHQASDDERATSPKHAEPLIDDQSDPENVNKSVKHKIANRRAPPPRVEDSPERAPSRPDTLQTSKHAAGTDHVSDSATSTSRASSPVRQPASLRAKRKRIAESTNDEESPVKKAKQHQVAVNTNSRKRTAAAVAEREELSESDASRHRNLQRPTSASGALNRDRVTSIAPGSEQLETSLPTKRVTRANSASRPSTRKRKKLASTLTGAVIGTEKSTSVTQEHESMPVQDQDISDTGRTFGSKRRRKQAHTDPSDVASLKKDVKVLTEKNTAHLEVTHWLVRRLLMLGEDVTTVENQNLRTLISTIEQQPNQLFDKLLEDLQSEQALNKIYREDALYGIGSMDISKEFTRPYKDDVQYAWSDFQDYIVWAVGRSVKTPVPSLTSSAFLGARVEDIAYGRVPDHQLQSCVEDLREFLVSPHAQQSLMSAVFCRWVFANPEKMRKDMHNDTSLATLREFSLSNGRQQAAHLDKLAFQAIASSTDFERCRVEPRRFNLLRSFDKVTASICTPRAEKDFRCRLIPEKFTKAAVELKRDLMLSPAKYRLHYARPGVKFDGSWMVGMASKHWEMKDAEAENRDVLLCLFPAMIEQVPPQITNNTPLEEVLVMNKKFFPAYGENPMNGEKKRVVGKAYMLILDDENKAAHDTGASSGGPVGEIDEEL